MVYKKDSEETIFNNIFDSYFIKTDSELDECTMEDVKHIYKLYVDKKNIGINSFVAYLINKGCIRNKSIWNKLLVKSNMISIIDETNDKKNQLKLVRQKIKELKMIENNLLADILKIKSEILNDKDGMIILDYTDKTIHTIDYEEQEMVKIIYCGESKVHTFSPLFINLVEIYCNNCLYIQPEFDFSIYSKLEHLDISYASINTLYDMENLKYLRCDHTDVRILPELKNIEYLNISNTHIELLNENYKNIEALYCSNTLITKIPKEYTKLKTLHCNNIYIETLHETYIELEELNVENTNISIIPNTFTKLKKLICSKTNLKPLPEELVNIEYLDIHDTPRYDDDITWEQMNESVDTIPITYKKLKNLIITNTKIKINVKDFPILESIE